MKCGYYVEEVTGCTWQLRGLRDAYWKAQRKKIQKNKLYPATVKTHSISQKYSVS